MPIRKGSGVPDYHEIGKRRPIPLQFNSLPFRDHSGNTAYMAFYSYRNYPLSRLFVFAIYFTHPDASPDHVDQKGLLNALMNGSTRFRLELFFLPGADEEDCMKHYRGEKEVRGDYHAQITIVEESNPDQDFSPDCRQLPGLVPSYTECGELNHYHSMLFICEGKNWTDGEQIMRMVEFDPVSAEE